mmetsp:Transcript_15789/g.29983  ORF Transcript_15789/g.29983 Transcript_15789/m.29983 type:complete len:237 (-) Transcript_15789:347-1057(-)
MEHVQGVQVSFHSSHCFLLCSCLEPIRNSRRLAGACCFHCPFDTCFAFFNKPLDNRQLAQHRGCNQRGATILSWKIYLSLSLLYKVLDNGHVAFLRCDTERRPPTAGLCINIGLPLSHEPFDHMKVPFACCHPQWGNTVSVGCVVNVCLGLRGKPLYNFQVTVLRREAERGTSHPTPGVNLSLSNLNEPFDHWQLAFLCCRMQGSHTVLVGCSDFGLALAHEPLYNFYSAVKCRPG